MILVALTLWSLFCFLLIRKRLPSLVGPVIAIFSTLMVVTLFSYSYYFFLFTSSSFLLFESLISSTALIALLLVKRDVQKLIKQVPSLWSSRPHYFSLLTGICFLFYTVKFFLGAKRWGEWDAWAIWSLHAKFLNYNNEFVNLFTNEISWTHPDYPLMLPSLISILWRSVGVTPLVPLLIDYFIGLMILALVFFVVKGSDPIKALLALSLMVVTLIFPYVGIQYADPLLALFMLIPIIMKESVSEDSPFAYLIIGLFAAACSWVKNEGIAFFVVFSLIYGYYDLRNSKAMRYYLAGALLPVLVLCFFKIANAPESDLIYDQSSSTLEKVIDISRHSTILRYFLWDVMIVNYYPLTIIFILTFLFNKRYFRTFSFKIVMAMLSAYYLVYLVTPHDLFWHLDKSYNRLIHHIMPIIITSMALTFSTDKHRNQNSSIVQNPV